MAPLIKSFGLMDSDNTDYKIEKAVKEVDKLLSQANFL